MRVRSEQRATFDINGYVSEPQRLELVITIETEKEFDILNQALRAVLNYNYREVVAPIVDELRRLGG